MKQADSAMQPGVVSAMHLARDRISLLPLLFLFLLDGGHGPGLNAILTGLQAHHLTDISLYESDNGIQQPCLLLLLFATRNNVEQRGTERRREGESDIREPRSPIGPV